MRSERPTVEVLNLADLDGDGLALEVQLPAEYVDCDTYLNLFAGVRPDGSGLKIIGTREASVP